MTPEADPPRKYHKIRNGSAKRVRNGVHLHSAADPEQIRITDLVPVPFISGPFGLDTPHSKLLIW